MSDSLISRDGETMSEPVIPESREAWKCFFCEFRTYDASVAAAHFGDRDDPIEFKPICKWWERMSKEDRVEAFQDMIQRTNSLEHDLSEAQAKAERDAHNCGDTCDALQAKLDAALAMLRRLEWAAWESNTSLGGYAMCPECKQAKPTHASGCELAKLLEGK